MQTPQQGGPPTDDELLRTISERLAGDPDVDTSDIEISVQGGRVVLAGLVPSQQARKDAESIAASTRGVREIENRLKVQDGGAQPF